MPLRVFVYKTWYYSALCARLRRVVRVRAVQEPVRGVYTMTTLYESIVNGRRRTCHVFDEFVKTDRDIEPTACNHTPQPAIIRSEYSDRAVIRSPPIMMYLTATTMLYYITCIVYTECPPEIYTMWFNLAWFINLNLFRVQFKTLIWLEIVTKKLF